MSKLDDLTKTLGFDADGEVWFRQQVKDLLLEMIGENSRETQPDSSRGGAHRLNRNINQAVNVYKDDLRQKVTDL